MSIHQPISNTSGELVGFCDRSEVWPALLHSIGTSSFLDDMCRLVHGARFISSICSPISEAYYTSTPLRNMLLLRHEMSGNSCEVSCIMTLSDVCLLSLMIIFLSTGLQGSPNVRKWRAGSDVEHCLHKTNKEAFHAQEELLGNDCVGFGS